MMPMMGRSYRHPITGEIQTASNPAFKDFLLVDLFAREACPTSLDKLAADKYLFRAVPLLNRTWLYHDDFRLQITLEKDEDAMVAVALGHWCVDAPINGGRWSPTIALAPLVMGVAFMNDLLALLASIALFVMVQSISGWTNSAKWYCYLRPLTFIPRTLVYLFLLVRFMTRSNTPMVVVGFLVAFVAAAADLAGDVMLLRSVPLRARWQITHRLANRVYVCSRIGAARYEHRYGSRGIVPEEVVGFSPWRREHALIADLQGILFELRPVSAQDWEILADQLAIYEEKAEVLGVDIFDDHIPTAAALVDSLSKPRSPKSPKSRNRK